MKKSIFIVFTCCLFLHTNAMSLEGIPEESFVAWRDTLYVRMADSVFKDGAIEFNVDIYRPNADWNNDFVLGDVDFYFKFSNKAFNGTLAPSFVSGSVHEKLDIKTLGRKNLLFLDKAYHAGRLLVSLRTDHAGGDKLDIPLKTWVTLFRLKVPMNDPDRNPGIVWDEATGLMTAGGDPILAKKMGSVDKNPKGTVKSGNIIITPQWACEGSDVKLYVEDVTTSGTALKFTWADSIPLNKKEIGIFDAPATGKSSRNYSFEIRGIGDTLVIKNAPGILDSMVFSCVLTDASVAGQFIPGECTAFLRDSIFGYLASTTPSTDFGMSTVVDTINKCPSVAASAKFYFFGPSEDEIYNPDEIAKLTVYCKRLDADLNVHDTTFLVDMAILTAVGNFMHDPADLPAGNSVNTWLYEFEISLNKTGKYWIESIETDACSNGAPFCKYDTVYVKEVEGDISYSLRSISLGVGESIALDTARDSKPYLIKLKNIPSPIGGLVQNKNKVYSYKASTIAGKDTVLYTYTKDGCNMKAERMIDVVEKYYLNMKVLLEGAYLGVDDKGVDTMNCNYAEKEYYGEKIFPRTNVGRLESPYDNNHILDSKISKIGDIETSVTICDWIYIRLVQVDIVNGVETPGMVYVDSLSVFVLRNGEICNADGMPVSFKNLGNKKVYVEVSHRNHLKIMSSIPKKLPTTFFSNTYLCDFTDPTQVWSGNEVLKLVKGKYCLCAGNIDGDTFLGTSDKSLLMMYNGLIQYNYDIDQDGFIGVLDKNFIITNNGKYSRP